MCTVITTIYGGGEPSHVAINMHSKYSYMVEGSPHVWSCVAINMHGSYKNMVEGTPHMWAINVHANY